MEISTFYNPDFCNISQAPHTGDIDWGQFKGLSEDQIEELILRSGQPLPDSWLDPTFRDTITGTNSAAVNANLSNGELAYYDEFGEQARGIYYARNIQGQGAQGYR